MSNPQLLSSDPILCDLHTPGTAPTDEALGIADSIHSRTRALCIPELLYACFAHMTGRELVATAHVCKSWERIATEVLYRQNNVPLTAVFKELVEMGILRKELDSRGAVPGFDTYKWCLSSRINHFQPFWLLMTPSVEPGCRKPLKHGVPRQVQTIPYRLCQEDHSDLRER